MSKKYNWTENDNEIFINNYEYMDVIDFQKKYYPEIPYSTLTYKANKLGLKRRKDIQEWSDEEIENLKKYYNKYSKQYLIDHYFNGRTIDQITKKLNELKLEKTDKPRNGKVMWTKENLDLLYNIYPNMNTEEFYNKYFSDKIGLSGLYSKINKLGIKKTEEFLSGWTKEEIEILKNDYQNPDIKVEDIAFRLNKDVKQIQYYANKILKIHRHIELFTEEERKLLAKIYPNKRTSDFSYLFPNCTVEQIERYARRMGLRKTKEYIKWVTLEGTKNSIITSKPQTEINDLLQEMNINFISEYSCKYYLVDHYLTDYKLMIEVQGDFWHCSPLLKNKNSKGIKRNVKKDKAKNTYIKNHYNINILYLWETDVNENIELCKKLIELYINKNGILDDYHSFNYMLNDDDTLMLINDKYVIGY